MVVPAECFHVGEFVADELETRGWSTCDMPGITPRQMLEVDMLIACSKSKKHGPFIRLGDLAEFLAEAFGTSADVWRNIETSYLACCRSKGINIGE